MSGKFFTRLLKAFITSLVAVYVFINGPNMYAQLQYWFGDIKPLETNTASAVSIIKPIRLPVSDIDEQPLPHEATLTIEKIHVSVPILFGIPTDAKTIYDNLINGVVHYSLTPKPGEGGASIILCHSSLYPWQVSKYGIPCALIGKLVPGDKFTVRYSDGRIFNYAMTKSLVFDPLTGNDNKRIAEFEQNPKPTIILVTCWPINSTSHRIAVQAELD